MLEILSRDDIYKIHTASLEILEQVGVVFKHKDALKIFEDAGANVDYRRELVKIPERLVKWALNKVPSQVTLLARDPKYNLKLGDGRVHYTNGYGADHVLDFESGQRRDSTLKDLENFTRMADYFDNVEYVYPSIFPKDAPKAVVDRYIYLTLLKNTSKHCANSFLSLDGFKDIVRMAEILVGGEEEFLKKSAILDTGASTAPPLKYPEHTTACILENGKYKMPATICSAALAGASGPVTISGTLVQMNAENLAALILYQIVGPGTPIIYGTIASNMDLKTGIPTYGSPECGLINAAFVQIAHYYNMPFYGTAGIIDSKVPDEQAAFESSENVLLTALAGGDFIHDAVYSILETGLTACYEQFAIGYEIVNRIKRIVKGVGVTDETIALDIIRDVGVEGSYLKQRSALRHTRKYLLDELWQPAISDRLPRSIWENRGSKTIMQMAREKVKEILETHKPEPLDKDVEARLEAFVREVAKLSE